MTLDNLIEQLSKVGNVQLCKEGFVFTLLMTGTGLSKSKTVGEIQMKVLDYTGNKYPLIECMKNDETFLCIILKPHKPIG